MNDWRHFYESLEEESGCGGDFGDKMHLLMDFTDHPGEVADPWYTDDFDTTWRDVEEGCRGVLSQTIHKVLICG